MRLSISTLYEELFLVFMMTVTVNGYNLSGDMCQRKVFGDGGDDGVYDLETSCHEGQIDWIDPRGGLDLKFHRTTNSRLCLLLKLYDVSIHVYDGDKKVLTIGTSSGPLTKEHCIDVKRSSDHILFEAWKPGADAEVTIQYLVEPPQPPLPLEDDVCRPCSPEEVVEAYCSHDFVVKGVMTSLEEDSVTSMSVLSVRVTDVYRQIKPVFTFSDDGATTGRVYRPVECATRLGDGDFLFMGRVRFGRAHLTCAPQWTEWQRIRKSGIKKQCDLDP